MLVILTVIVPVLVRVAVCDGLLVPINWAAKAMLEGVSETALLLPTPVRATFWGVFWALSAKARTALRVPVMLGVKTSVTVHEPPGARVATQVLAVME